MFIYFVFPYADDLLTTNGKLTLEITFKPEFTYSGILTYISRNFNWLYHHLMIYKLTKNQFVTLLKHKFLNAKMEEDALTALCIWLENNKAMANNITEILENIFWGYVTLPSLLDVVKNFPLIRNNAAFKKIFTQELSRRRENKEINVPPRASYKYGKKEDEKQTFEETIIMAMLEPKDSISRLILSKKPEHK